MHENKQFKPEISAIFFIIWFEVSIIHLFIVRRLKLNASNFVAKCFRHVRCIFLHIFKTLNVVINWNIVKAPSTPFLDASENIDSLFSVDEWSQEVYFLSLIRQNGLCWNLNIFPFFWNSAFLWFCYHYILIIKKIFLFFSSSKAVKAV